MNELYIGFTFFAIGGDSKSLTSELLLRFWASVCTTLVSLVFVIFCTSDDRCHVGGALHRKDFYLFTCASTLLRDVRK